METKVAETRNTENVTVSRVEYELFQAQSERISALEKQVELLTEALRLSVSVKSSGIFRGRARHEIMDPSLTESGRDLEVRHGIQFAESKRSPTGSIMGGTNNGMPRQRQERPCVV